MTTMFTATCDKIGYYVEQARDTSANLMAVLLQSVDVQADADMANHANLAQIFGAGNVEADFTNYTRRTLSSPSRTVDAVNDRVLLSVASPLTWPAAGGTNNDTLARILYCYLPSAASSDTLILPLMCTTINVTTDGNDLVITLAPDGFAVVRRPT